MRFDDRADAGRRLAGALARHAGADTVVLALPRGGVPVAAEVAGVLHAPLDLILIRKVGVPYQPELAMGAVADGAEPVVVRNEDVIAMADVDEATFTHECRRELAELERRRRRYLGTRAPAELTGRTAIVIDDGVATGATTRAALRATRLRAPRRLVLAVPVAPADTLALLRAEADEVVCLHAPQDFGAVGYFYVDFEQVSDEEVVAALARFAPHAAGPARHEP